MKRETGRFHFSGMYPFDFRISREKRESVCSIVTIVLTRCSRMRWGEARRGEARRGEAKRRDATRRLQLNPSARRAAATRRGARTRTRTRIHEYAATASPRTAPRCPVCRIRVIMYSDVATAIHTRMWP